VAEDGESAISTDDSTLPPGTVLENAWVSTAEDSMATFSIDVDNASYTRTRGELEANVLPRAQDVRVEEFINFFDYKYPMPDDGSPDPFEVFFEGTTSPFGEGLHMLRLGLQGGEVGVLERPAANLVFLLDVSGSMGQSNKLPMLQESMRIMLESLTHEDTVAIVTYAGIERVALEPTSVSERQTILSAIDSLTSGGSTNGEGGIRVAYELAQDAFIQGGINRVILGTDGDFNVGMTGEPLIQLVETYKERNISLTALLFGRDGIDDAFLENLTNRGEGNYFHIDRREEAVRILSEDLVGTLMVIARDVKVQVFMNPEVVARYRLVGYDNRVLADEDFNNDFVDAGEMGAGHTVTGLLEVEFVDGVEFAATDLVAEVRVRYKAPEGTESTLLAYPMQFSDIHESTDDASDSMRLAMGVAEFAEILRHSQHSEGARFQEVLDLIAPFAEGDADVNELVRLIQRAQSIWQ
jgi:Ca-activated chloride channel family protein